VGRVRGCVGITSQGSAGGRTAASGWLSMVYQSEKLIRSQSRPGSSFVSLLAERPLRKGPKLRVGSWYSFFAYSLILARFLHHFPQNVDPGALASAMSHVELSSDGSAQYSPGRLTPQPVDDFPDLYAARLGSKPSRGSGSTFARDGIPHFGSRRPETIAADQVTSADASAYSTDRFQRQRAIYVHACDLHSIGSGPERMSRSRS